MGEGTIPGTMEVGVKIGVGGQGCPQGRAQWGRSLPRDGPAQWGRGVPWDGPSEGEDSIKTVVHTTGTVTGRDIFWVLPLLF